MIIEIITIGACSIIVWILYKRSKKLEKEINLYQSQLKSAYVKFGKSFEHFVPFIENFPADKEKTVFLGMPIDFISFDKDSIKFIEVKTGQSKLSSKQKQIQNQINKGLVEFKEVRYD